MKFMWTINPDRDPRTMRGFSVPAALFIILILAGLAAFLVTISGNQQLGHAQDVVGSRALLAARTGVEWGVYQVLNKTGGAAATFRGACDGGSIAAASGAASVSLSNLVNLNGIVVQVDCTSTHYFEGSSDFRAYQIVATACTNASCPAGTASQLPRMYVERRVVTVVTN